MSEWKSIETAPEGTTVKLRRSGCESYDTEGKREDGKWQMKSFFINPKTMQFFSTPTHWAAMPEPTK